MRILKKTSCIVLALVLVLSLAACTTEVNLNIKCDEALANALANGGSNVPAANPTPDPVATSSEAVPQTEATQEPASDSTTAAPADDVKTDDPASESTTAAPANKELSSSSTKEEVVAKYVEVYNTTKADGTLKGSDAISCEKVVLDGKENSMLKGIADSVMKADAKGMNLPPYTDDNPGNTCATTPDDIQDYSYTDNGDGTATIKLTVKDSTNSRRFQDPAGNMLNVMEDVASALENISVISWSEGDANSNTVLTSSGYCEVTYDKNTNLMTKAEYVLITVADVQHANVAIFKDKSAQATFKYVTTFPQQ